jgi:hypothetical protein
MNKKAQEDFNEYNDPEPISDRENWEEEQVFRDQQAENEDQYDEDELTNTGEPPMSQEQLAAMHSKQLGVAILTWHGGQNSPLYSLGSTLAAGKEITSEMALNGIRELKSLLGGTADAPQLTPGDRIEIENIMGEIDNRFLEPEREERRLDAQTQESLQEEQMFPTVETGPEDAFGSSGKEVKIAWVHKNCQFIRTARIIQNAANIIKTSFAKAYSNIKTAAQVQVGEEKLLNWALELIKQNPAWSMLKQTIRDWSKTWGDPKTSFDKEKLWNDNWNNPRMSPIHQAIAEVSKTYAGPNEKEFMDKITQMLKVDLGLGQEMSAFRPGFKPNPREAEPVQEKL